jgi:hypothetical protein
MIQHFLQHGMLLLLPLSAAAQQQIKFVHILAKIRGRTGQSACY